MAKSKLAMTDAGLVKPPAKIMYETVKLQELWQNLSIYTFDTLAQVNAAFSSLGTATYDVANKRITIPPAGCTLVTTPIDNWGQLKLLVDFDQYLATEHNFGLEYSTDNGVTWALPDAASTMLPAGKTVRILGNPLLFKISFAAVTNGGFLHSFCVLTSNHDRGLTGTTELVSSSETMPTASQRSLLDTTPALPLISRIRYLEAGTNVALDSTTHPEAIIINATGGSIVDPNAYNGSATTHEVLPGADFAAQLASVTGSTVSLHGIEGAGGIVIKHGKLGGTIRNIVIDGSAIAGGGATTAGAVTTTTNSGLLNGVTANVQAVVTAVAGLNSRTIAAAGVTAWAVIGDFGVSTKGYHATFCLEGFFADHNITAFMASTSDVGFQADETVVVPIRLGPVVAAVPRTYDHVALQALKEGDIIYGIITPYTVVDSAGTTHGYGSGDCPVGHYFISPDPTGLTVNSVARNLFGTPIIYI